MKSRKCIFQIVFLSIADLMRDNNQRYKLSKEEHMLSPRYTHGPIVKTGPTAGQNRSRTESGTW